MTRKQAPDPGSPIAKPEVSTVKRPKMTDAEQRAEFEKTAREHGAEGDEAEFNDVLRKLGKTPNRIAERATGGDLYI